MKYTLKQVEACLPDAPDGYEYKVQQISSIVTRVILYHPDVYTYTTEKVFTVWGFIKSGKVYPARNSKTAQARSVCDLMSAYKLSPFTVIKPKHSTLQDK